MQQSAVAFVEMLDVRTSLKVDQDELIAHMLAAGAFTDVDLAMMQQVCVCFVCGVVRVCVGCCACACVGCVCDRVMMM